MSMNDINKLITHEMELQIPHRICAQIPQESFLQRKESCNRKDSTTTMRMEGRKDHRSGSMSRSHPSIRRNSAEVIGIRVYGISQGKECCDAI